MYWKAKDEGIIFVYTADDFEGDLTIVSEEGTLEWVKIEDLIKLPQFDQNRIFAPYLFKDELFESKSLLDNNARVLKNTIRTM